MFSGVQKTSLVDFPDTIATVLFVPGCNLRCPFCHNWRLVLDPDPPRLSADQAVGMMEGRRGYVDAAVITGGEPTIHERLPCFVRTLKELGYRVKLDTNGMKPASLEACLPHLDYVALDLKTSLDRYSSLGKANLDGIVRSIALLREGPTEHEVRCTAVPGLVDERAVEMMGETVAGVKRFAFQQFVPGDTLDPEYNALRPYSRQQISAFADTMSSFAGEVVVRV
jgi:pyruvate formate lyase activating enzyme